MFTHYYGGYLRKIVVAFGTLFNNVYITHPEDGTDKTIRVPLTYAPKEKFVRRWLEESSISDTTKVGIRLPQMSFVLSRIAIDPSRRRNKVNSDVYTDDSNNLKQMSSLRNFATELHSSSSMTIEVEISASTLSTEERRYAFFVRDVHRLSETGPVASSSMAGSVSQLAQLVGRMPMKDIVGETSDMIEKMCIQSALELTQNNRASAAEMLGLSRQSLYVKLHRYGMSEFNDKS